MADTKQEKPQQPAWAEYLDAENLKKLRSVKKKLDAVRDLKKKIQSKEVTPNDDQKAKIKKEKELQKEVQELQSMAQRAQAQQLRETRQQQKEAAKANNETGAAGTPSTDDDAAPTGIPIPSEADVMASDPRLKQAEKLTRQYHQLMNQKQKIIFAKVKATEKAMERIRNAPELLEEAKRLEDAVAKERHEKLARAKANALALIASAAAVGGLTALSCVDAAWAAQQRAAEEERLRQEEQRVAEEQRRKEEEEAEQQRVEEEARQKAEEEERAREEAERERVEQEEREKREEEERVKREAEKAEKEAKKEADKAAKQKKKEEEAAAAAERPDDEDEEEASPPDEEDVVDDEAVADADDAPPDDDEEEVDDAPEEEEKVEEVPMVPLNVVRNSTRPRPQQQPVSPTANNKKIALAAVAAEQQRVAQSRTKRAPRKPTLLQRSAIMRLQTDLIEVTRNPLETVHAMAVEDDLLTWHVNVAPKRGPFAGHILHLVLHFPDNYPIDPPKVRLCSEMMHEAVMEHSSGWEVCLEVREPSARKRAYGAFWHPDLTVHSILLEFQTLFEDEQFQLARDTYGQDFGDSIRQWQTLADRYSDKDVGHGRHHPWPPIPTYNGPFQRSNLHLADGCLTARGDQWRWARCTPTPPTSGTHRFRVVLQKGGPCRVGWATDAWKVPALGDDPHSVALNEEGSLNCCGEPGDVEEPVPLERGDVVECQMDYDNGVITWYVNGKQTSCSVTITDHLTLQEGTLTPSLSVKQPCEVELQCYGTMDVPELSTSSPPTRDAHQCFLTKRSVEESPLGVGVHVDRDPRDGTIKDISSSFDLLSWSAFDTEKLRRGVRGDRFEIWLPLPLSVVHAPATFGQMESAFTSMNRNPDASTLYDPPFKPAVVARLLPKLVTSTVTGYVQLITRTKHAQRLTDRVLFAYRQLHYMLLMLADKHKVVRSEAERAVATVLEAPAKGARRGPEVSPAECLVLFLLTESKLEPLLTAACNQIIGRVRDPKVRRYDLAALFVQVHLLREYGLSSNSLEYFSSTDGTPTDEQYDSFYQSCKTLMGEEKLTSLEGATAETVVAELLGGAAPDEE